VSGHISSSPCEKEKFHKSLICEVLKEFYDNVTSQKRIIFIENKIKRHERRLKVNSRNNDENGKKSNLKKEKREVNGTHHIISEVIWFFFMFVKLFSVANHRK
jgi:hypothetical protein